MTSSHTLEAAPGLGLLSWTNQEYLGLDHKWYGHPPFKTILSHCTVNPSLDVGN